MKKIKFDERNLESLKTNELRGISSIVGGQKYPSQWRSGSLSGSDTVYWGAGETGIHALQSQSGTLYVDIIFEGVAPGGGRTEVSFDKFVGYF